MRQTVRIGGSAILTLAALAFLLAVPAPAAQKVLRLVFDGPVMEEPDESAKFMAIFAQRSAHTLHDIVKEIHKATDDADIAGIAMIIAEPQFGMAQLQELSRALADFRAKGKKIFCYTDGAGNGTYALACAAN